MVAVVRAFSYLYTLPFIVTKLTHHSQSFLDAADGEKTKKKVKKIKKAKSAALGTCVVDVDDAWEQSAPSREEIDKKWELEGVEDEQPMVVVADGNEVVDIQDLPVYVDSDKYLDEFQGRKKEEKSVEDEDLSPPRKTKELGRREGDYDDNKASPLGRSKNGNVTSSSDADQKVSERNGMDDDENRDNVLRPRRQDRDQRRSEVCSDDTSPPRRPTHRKGDDNALPQRRDSNEVDSLEHAKGGVILPPRCSSVERKLCAEDNEDASPLRKSRHITDGVKQEEPRRRRSPNRSSAVLDRQRRVDSLGRDIPPHPRHSTRRSSSASREENNTSRRRNKNARSRSNSRGGDRDGDRNAFASPSSRRGRQCRNRSPRARRSDSRSPSMRRRNLPRKSTRWGSPRRSESTRGRSHSHGKYRRPSPQRSRSRSRSPERRSSRRKSLDLDNRSADKNLRTAIKSPSYEDLPAVDSPLEKSSKAETHDEKTEKKAGLFTAAEFDQQRAIKAKRKDMLHGIDASEMGANAKTMYRDKRGRKLDMLNEMVRQKEVLDGKRKREEREEYEWGTGEVQKQDRRSQLELMEQMKHTPFARHEDDEELERKRRGRMRAFDPVNSKSFQDDRCKKTKESKKDKKMKRKYAGPPAPPNRFGIIPGYRWDGVVRGTNWEERIMMRYNANAAVSEEAYKYAVADM